MSHLTTIRSLRSAARGLVTVLLVGLGASGCGSFDVPDYNNQSLQDLVNNPSPSGVATAAQGVLRDARAAAGEYTADLSILGRETYNLSVANGTLPTYLLGPLNTGVFFVLFTWDRSYAGIRDANILLHAVDQVTGLTPAEKEAARGYAKTMQAYLFWHLIASRDTFGLPVEVDIATTQLAPIADKAAVYTKIDALLDQAKVHLQAGGAAFPFKLTPGFSGFDTPTSFLKFNRALKARVDVYNNDFASVLTALGESFIDPAAALTLGVYHTYTNNSGDATNPLFNASFFWAHPSFWTAAQTTAGGIGCTAATLATCDQRAATKVVVGPTGTLISVSSNLKYTQPSGPTSSLTLIRNEELILLRAEANLAYSVAGGTVGPNAALARNDINTIRTTAGGLPPISAGTWAGMTPDQQLAELLYNKRYSLWWEGGFSWIDARHYGRLTTLPRDFASHRIFEILPYELSECLQRSNAPKGCTGVAGL